MERFFDYLRTKYFIDYDDDEIKDICKAMDIFMKKLRDIFNELSEVLSIACLVPCGSMEEKTTVWGEESTTVEFDPSCAINTIEFDCLAVLKPIVSDIAVQSSCPGYKKIISKTLSNLLYEKTLIEQSESYKKAFTDHTNDVMDTLKSLLLSSDTADSGASECASEKKPISFTTFVSQQIEKKIKTGENVSHYKDLLRLHKFVSGTSKAVSSEFTANIDLAIEAMCQSCETESNIEGEILVYELDMPTGTLQYGRCLPGCQLALVWKTKNKPSVDKMIYADFVPAFQISEQTSSEEDDSTKYLVAKGCGNSFCDAGCWRLSHCSSECKAIQTTSQCHRDVYKFMKIFNHSKLSRRVDNALKSYHIKTALLSHTKHCKGTSHNITDCLCKTLDIINSYVENGMVPHWKDQNYTLELKQDSCHRFVPTLLQFIFNQTVKHSPVRLYLTICCEWNRGKEMYFYKCGSKLSDLVCQIIEGKDCYSNLESEVENTLIQAADLPPLLHQYNLRYSLVVEDKEITPDTIIYQR